MPAGTRITTADISLGIGVLEFGNYDTNDVFQGFQDVGAIKGVFSMEITRETRDFETSQPLIVVKRQVLRERVQITFTMAEWRVANLKLAFGGGVISSSQAGFTFIDGTTVAPTGDLTTSVTVVGTNDQFKLGGQCALDKVGLRFTHVKSCVTGKRQIAEVYFAQAVGTATLPWNEEDWNQFEVQFIALADTTRPAGEQYFTLIDERN
jgi:hypothetical protein